jgi:hypothetical protein
VYYRVDGRVESFELDTIGKRQVLDVKTPISNAKLQLLGVKDSIEFNMTPNTSFDLNIFYNKKDTINVKIQIH